MNTELYIISLEDLIPNAFIELNQRTEEQIYKIPMIVLEKYGDAVAKKLKSEGKKIGFSYSRSSMESIKVLYNEYFILEDEKLYPASYNAVILKNGIELDYMIKKFRTHMPFELLLAYMDEDVVQKGLINNMNEIVKEKGFQKKKSK